MMRLSSMVLVALAQVPNFAPTVEFVDSRDEHKVTYMVVNKTCKIKVLKTDLKDYDTLINLAVKKCGL